MPADACRTDEQAPTLRTANVSGRGGARFNTKVIRLGTHVLNLGGDSARSAPEIIRQEVSIRSSPPRRSTRARPASDLYGHLKQKTGWLSSIWSPRSGKGTTFPHQS